MIWLMLLLFAVTTFSLQHTFNIQFGTNLVLILKSVMALKQKTESKAPEVAKTSKFEVTEAK